MINSRKSLKFGDHMPNGLADMVMKSNIKHDHIFKSENFKIFRDRVGMISNLDINKINRKKI